MKKINQFFTIIKPDFNVQKMPASLRFEASQWYFRISNFFLLVMFLASALLLLISAAAWGNISNPDFFGEGSWFHTFFQFAAIFIIIITLVVIVIGNAYSYNKKHVMISFLKKEIKSLDFKYDLLIKDKGAENMKQWTYLDSASKKDVIIQMYEKLQDQEKSAIQDTFLDLLNQKDILWKELPVELMPRLENGFDARMILLNRIVFLKDVLESI